MGVDTFDINSFEHFVMGVLSGYTLRGSGFSVTNNFLLSNISHLIIELLEHNVYQGIILESFTNHVTDIILFFVGWVLSFNIKPMWTCALPMMWIILLVILFKEIYRELLPYSNGLIKGAFVKKRV